MSIITLTTDFGSGSPYVAAMKGVILSINPAATIVDITHDIPAQDVRQAAVVLEDVADYFPPDTIHVAVVDPGVGTQRSDCVCPYRIATISCPGQRAFKPAGCENASCKDVSHNGIAILAEKGLLDLSWTRHFGAGCCSVKLRPAARTVGAVAGKHNDLGLARRAHCT